VDFGICEEAWRDWKGPSQAITSKLVRNQPIGKQCAEAAATGCVATLGELKGAFAEDYLKELLCSIEWMSKQHEEFFVYVVRRRDYMMNNYYRQQFMPLTLRPQAQPNTDLWKIDCKENSMELVWSLPTRDAIMELAIKAPSNADPFLVHCCKEFADGRLNASYDNIILSGRASAGEYSAALAGRTELASAT
jgi:hypothetical protein